MILRLIGDYAQQTGNHQLLGLVEKYKDFHGNQSLPSGGRAMRPPKAVQQVLDPKMKDYTSIINVIDRFQGQPVSTATLGSYRRRWYDYSSRTPGSSLNRLDDTLQQMVADGVLKTTRGSQGALLYSPGPLYQQYQQKATV